MRFMGSVTGCTEILGNRLCGAVGRDHRAPARGIKLQTVKRAPDVIVEALAVAERCAPVDTGILQAVNPARKIPPENQFLSQTGHADRFTLHLMRLKDNEPLVACHGAFFFKDTIPGKWQEMFPEPILWPMRGFNNK